MPCQLVEFDHLINVPIIKDGEDFQKFVTPVSRAETSALADPCLRTVQHGEVKYCDAAVCYDEDVEVQSAKEKVIKSTSNNDSFLNLFIFKTPHSSLIKTCEYTEVVHPIFLAYHAFSLSWELRDRGCTQRNIPLALGPAAVVPRVLSTCGVN